MGLTTADFETIYEPTTFAQQTQEAALEKNAFVKSNVIMEDSRLTALAAIGGRTGDMPAYKPLSNSEPNYSSDDNTSFSTPEGFDKGIQRWRLAGMNNSWSLMDFARELGLADPMGSITGSIGSYWATVEQTRLIRSALGVLADNVANDSGDMLYSIANDDATAVTDAERISGDAIIRAAATNGDKQTDFSAIAVHGIVYAQMRILNMIDTVVDSEANTIFNMYQGMYIVVDDSMPATIGTNRITYTSILFKAGAFGMGIGSPVKPSAMTRVESSGDGGGETIIHSRETRIIHPWGCDFTSSSVSGVSPSFAELEAAANWDRIFYRKNIGMAFLQTNG